MWAGTQLGRFPPWARPAAGGLGYSLAGKPLRRVRWVGPYLAGVVTVLAYMGALLWALRLAGDPTGRDMTSRSGLVSFGIVSLFFGIMMGRMWFKEDDEDAAWRAEVNQRRAARAAR